MRTASRDTRPLSSTSLNSLNPLFSAKLQVTPLGEKVKCNNTPCKKTRKYRFHLRFTMNTDINYLPSGFFHFSTFSIISVALQIIKYCTNCWNLIKQKVLENCLRTLCKITIGFWAHNLWAMADARSICVIK